MPRIAYLSETREEFFQRLDALIHTAKESLLIKRKVLEQFTDQNLYPYSKFYLRAIKERNEAYWTNHFSTIGIIGMNEACLNFLGEDIGTSAGHDFAGEVLDFMRGRMEMIQKETGTLFNLEATPGEGTAFRLAMIDKKQYPEMACANEPHFQNGGDPFYTNSSQLPVNYTDDIFEALSLQDDLQTRYTGGTVFHIFMGEQIDDIEATKNLVKKITSNFRLPYFTFSPTFSICIGHGYLNGLHVECPKCHEPTEVYSRIVGYLRPVNQWNNGKQSEFSIRKTYSIEKIRALH
jgi:ribonucleoside-triphosphate reductase (formate)